jgi:hypothetical protein
MNSYWLIGAFTLVTQLFVFFRWLHRRLRDAAIERGFIEWQILEDQPDLGIMPQGRAPLRAVPAGAIAVPSQGSPVFLLDTAWRIMYIMLRCDAGAGGVEVNVADPKSGPQVRGRVGGVELDVLLQQGLVWADHTAGRRCGTGGACGCVCGAWRD